MWLQVSLQGAVDLSSRSHMPSFLFCRGFISSPCMLHLPRIIGVSTTIIQCETEMITGPWSGSVPGLTP